MTSEFSIANSSSVWSDSRCVSGSRSLHKCTSDVAEDKTKSFRERPQPWGWRTQYNDMAMYTGMCHWTERGVFASLFSQCHQPVAYMYTGALRDRAGQGKWLETSKARGIRRKADRPNVLWAKIYIQRESNWESLRSPIILLRATHNQSHVHIRDIKQIAAASSTPRSWIQRPGETTSP